MNALPLTRRLLADSWRGLIGWTVAIIAVLAHRIRHRLRAGHLLRPTRLRSARDRRHRLGRRGSRG